MAKIMAWRKKSVIENNGEIEMSKIINRQSIKAKPVAPSRHNRRQPWLRALQHGGMRRYVALSAKRDRNKRNRRRAAYQHVIMAAWRHRQ